jgi:serine/threonine protein kinase
MLSRLSRQGAVNGLEGTRIGRYWLHDCLGHGSHTAVYKASTPSGNWCALKLVDTRMQGGENLAERLLQDAAVIEQIGHPHILPIQNAMALDRMTAVVMPLVDGLTLRDMMRAGRLDPDTAWTLMNQIAEPLQSAHQSGLTYRALKPANVLVRGGLPYLAEFGVAGRGVGQVGLALPDCQVSTPQYVAPEQVMGAEPDFRTDLYAFAVLAFELATGTPLYDGERAYTVLRNALNDDPPSAHARDSRVPAEVDAVLRRALSRDPRRRHTSLAHLIDELVCPPAADGGLPSAPPVTAEADAGAAVTVDSLIEVLSDVLTPDGDAGGGEWR